MNVKVYVKMFYLLHMLIYSNEDTVSKNKEEKVGKNQVIPHFYFLLSP